VVVQVPPLSPADAACRAGAAPGHAPARPARPLPPAEMAAVKAAIREGRYPLDPAKLAERLVALNLIEPLP